MNIERKEKLYKYLLYRARIVNAYQTNASDLVDFVRRQGNKIVAFEKRIQKKLSETHCIDFESIKKLRIKKEEFEQFKQTAEDEFIRSKKLNDRYLVLTIQFYKKYEPTQVIPANLLEEYQTILQADSRV